MIKHYKITKDNETFYLCNQAVKPTLEKLESDWDDVTCKNCRKQKPVLAIGGLDIGGDYSSLNYDKPKSWFNILLEKFGGK